MFRLVLLSVVSVSLWASDSAPLVRGVDSIGITVSDLDRSVDFYSTVLEFRKVSSYEAEGDELDHAVGLFGSHIRTARLQLGEEFIELTEYLTPRGRPIPPDSQNNDRWFQHIAIVTRDMDAAYARLREYKVKHASTSPQRLPDWNPNAGGIRAFYFRDPDGHALEAIWFPAGKGAAKWQSATAKDPLFLGIDHTAIAITDTEASVRFYRDVLGMQVAGESENYGPEQERLNHVFGARLRITGMRSPSGPGVEFLEYLAPRNGRPYPADERSNDLIHWQTRFLGTSADTAAQQLQNARSAFISTGVVQMPDAKAGFRKSLLVRDPDGHAVQIVER